MMTQIIFRLNSETAPAPQGFIERIELPVDGDAIEAPVYEDHKRGKNWASILVGKNAANMSRQFLPQRGKIIDISRLVSGDAIEIAGDYVSSGGNPSQERWIGVVVDTSQDVLVVDCYETIAKAISAARKGFRSLVVPTTEDELNAAFGPVSMGTYINEVDSNALVISVAELEAWLDKGEGLTSSVENEVFFAENIALVLQELKRLQQENTDKPYTATA